MADAGGWIEAMLAEASRPATGEASRPATGEASRPATGEASLRRPATCARSARSRPSRRPWVGASASDADVVGRGRLDVRTARRRSTTGDWYRAAAYVDFFVDEAAVIFGCLPWPDPGCDLVPGAARRCTRPELLELNRGSSRSSRLPDGRPFVARPRWAEFQAEVRADRHRLRSPGRTPRMAHLAELKETWRQIQDRDVDHLYGLLNEAVRPLGRTGRRRVLGRHHRPAVRRPVREVRRCPSQALVATRSGRTSTSRSRRCGATSSARSATAPWSSPRTTSASRGASIRAAAADARCAAMPSRARRRGWSRRSATGSRRRAYDFAWNKKGVCYYCVNCCVVMQLMPIDHVRVPGSRRGAADLPDTTRGQVHVACLQGPGRRAGALLHRRRTHEARRRRASRRGAGPRCVACGVGVAGVGHWATDGAPSGHRVRTRSAELVASPTLYRRTSSGPRGRYDVEACLRRPPGDAGGSATWTRSSSRRRTPTIRDRAATPSAAAVHVLVEKPLVLEPADGRELIDAAAAAGRRDRRRLHVALQPAGRWRPVAGSRTGELGALTYVRSFFGSSAVNLYRGDPEAYAEYGDGRVVLRPTPGHLLRARPGGRRAGPDPDDPQPRAAALPDRPGTDSGGGPHGVPRRTG